MKDLDRLLEPRWIVFDLLNPYLIDISLILDVQEEEDDYYNINTVLRKKGRIKRSEWGVLLSRRHSLFS